MEELYKYEDESILSDAVKNNQVNSGQYHLTALLCFFVGTLGIHRMVNKRVVSGAIMVSITVISIILVVSSFVNLISSISIFDNELNTIDLMFVIFSCIIAIIPSIWSFIDLIIIITGNFKDGETKLPIRSGKPFFKTWSNLVIIGCVVMQFLYYIIYSLTLLEF